MTEKRNEIPTTGLLYPMVDLFTGGMVMPLMFVNVVATWCLLSLTTPSLLTQAWMKELERKQSRPQESERDDKWSFCLTAGTLCPANQEKQ